MVSGAGAQGAIAFGANLVLVRLLLPEEFGRFALVQANIGVVAAVANFRVGDLLLREPDEIDDETLGGYMAALAFQTTVIGLGATLLLWAVDLLRADAALLLLSTAFAAWVNAQVRLYERRFEYRNLSLIETGSHAAGHLFTVAGALAGLGAIVLYLRLAVQLFGRLLGLGFAGGLRKISFRWPGREGWKTMLDKVRGFWLDGVLESSFDRIVILLVGALVGERATGFFYQARRLALVPHQLAQPITTRIAYNVFSHRLPRGRRIRGLWTTLRWEALLLSVVALVTVWLADPVVPWLFGPRWEPVVPLLIAMSGVMVSLTIFNTLNVYFMSLGRLQPYMVWGRGGQYAGLALLLVTTAVWTELGPALGLALGLSAAYLFGSASSAAYTVMKGDEGDLRVDRTP